MNIKTPIVYDISHYKEVADFNAINPRPFLMITKSTEGTGFVDNKFIRFFDGMEQAAMHRGCYHFHRKAYSATAQAQHFVNVISGVVTSNDILVLDVEEGGESASQLLEFMEYVKDVYPASIIMIYSRKNILDPISMTTAQKVRMKAFPTWSAGYPFNPDLYSWPPASYIPDQTKYGPVWLWQYSSSGIVQGIQGSVDLNWIHPDLFELLDGTAPPVEPEYIIDHPYDGVTRKRGDGVQVLVIEPGSIGKVEIV